MNSDMSDHLGGGDATYSSYKISNKVCQKQDRVLTEYKWSSTKYKVYEKRITHCQRELGPDDEDNVVEHDSISIESDNEDENQSASINESTIDIVDDTIPLESTRKPINSPGSIPDANKYKIDDIFVNFIQSFTTYCENRTHLVFDGPTFFDESCFPHNMILTDYVPVSVVPSTVTTIDIQVPLRSEYCKYAWCPNSLYEYLEDPESFSNKEAILRSNVEFLLNTLHCPLLQSLCLETRANETLSAEYPVDRLSQWNDAIVSLIFKHQSTLKSVRITASRVKSLSGKCSKSSLRVGKQPAKTSFPKLHELHVVLWDNQTKCADDCQEPISSSCEQWAPDWFPDASDQYWISLMKSQVHGKLTRLIWVSAANLNWNQVFQPIIDANCNSLEVLHMVETSKADVDLGGKGDSNPCYALLVSSSSTVLSCAAIKGLRNLKDFSLRKANCFLVELQYLPNSLEQISLDDIKIESKEFNSLPRLKRLKILRLAENYPNETTIPYGLPRKVSSFGVGQETLITLLWIRSLEELCIWGHRINVKVQEDPSLFRDALYKMNSLIGKICRYSDKVTPLSIENTLDTNYKHSPRNRTPTPAFLKALGQIAFVDEDCIVVHPKHY